MFAPLLTFLQNENSNHIFDLLKLKENKKLNCRYRVDFKQHFENPDRSEHLNQPKKEQIFARECGLNPPYICNNCLRVILHSMFPSWTSGNELIDRFIITSQLLSPYEEYPEWVPYSSFDCVKQIGEGGFGVVFSALWSLGIKTALYYEKRKYHHRTGPCTVALKKLKGEIKITEAFLSEVRAQFDFCHLYGITQDPFTLEYMFIMRFAPQGDLRRFLQQNFDRLSLPKKLGIAQTICAELEKIHAKGWVYGDLHSGNILLLNEENAFISDFGLCRPINEIKSKNDLYGVIPNIAPEILRGCLYSQAGDIYSLGIILWELVCGVVAFSDRSHDVHLIFDICDGLRPRICHFAPPIYNDLLQRCWDQDPSKRPSIEEVLQVIEILCHHRRNSFQDVSYCNRHDSFGNLLFDMTAHPDNKFYIFHQLANAQNAGYIYNLMNWKPNRPIHPKAVYTSRLLSYESLQNDIDIMLSLR